jgi:hypothetical protein
VDATTATVLGALGVAFITSTATVIVAFINNHRERSSSADEGMDVGLKTVLEQRIEFGEDRLEAAGLEIARKNEQLSEKNELIEALRLQVANCTCGRATT